MCSLQAPGAAAPHERHRGFPQAGREARPAAVIGKAPGAARGGLSGAASPLAQLEASRGSITPPLTAWHRTGASPPGAAAACRHRWLRWHRCRVSRPSIGCAYL